MSDDKLVEKCAPERELMEGSIGVVFEGPRTVARPNKATVIEVHGGKELDYNKHGQ